MTPPSTPPKQMPLFDVQPVTPEDIETDADVQERHRLALASQEENERRHERWQAHNRGKFNRRLCPCNKSECRKERAGR